MTVESVPGQSERQALFEFYKDTLRSMLTVTDVDDPVAFIINADDEFGREVICHVHADLHGQSREESEAHHVRLREEYRSKGRLLIVRFVASMSVVERVMPKLSSEASEIIARYRGQPGIYLVGIIAAAGFSYTFIPVSRPVSDGQHRSSMVMP